VTFEAGSTARDADKASIVLSSLGEGERAIRSVVHAGTAARPEQLAKFSPGERARRFGAVNLAKCSLRCAYGKLLDPA
jgi:hypothetical protein